MSADDRGSARVEREPASLTALLEITKQISLTVPSEALPSAIADAAARLLGVEWAVFRLLEDDQLVLTGVSGGAPSDLVANRVPLRGSLSGQVILEDRPVIADLEQLPAPLESTAARARARGFTRFLGIPLRVAGRTIGVLGILGSRPLTDQDRELGEAFAEQAAIAVEHARLWQATTTQADRLQALADLARLLSETLDPEVVGRRAVEAVCKLLSATSAVLYRLDPASERLLEVARADQGPSFEWTPVLERGAGIAGLAVERGAAVASPDVLVDARLVYPPEIWARVRPLPQRALMAAPLQIQGRILGALVVADRAGRVYTEQEMRLAQNFADQAALALENARLYDEAARGRREAERMAERLRALEEVNRLVSSSLQVEDVLRNLTAAVARFFDASLAAVWRLDVAAGRVHRAAAHGIPAIAAETRGELALGEGAVGWVMLHREPILWCDVEKDERLVEGPTLLRHGVRYLSVYPILQGQRALGAFAFGRGQPAAVTTETESLLHSLAAQAAVALDNARLHAETARRLDESRALLDVVRILNSTLDATQLLREVAIKIAQVCGVDGCSVARWDGQVMVPLTAQYADGRTRPDLWRAFTHLSQARLHEVPAHVRAVEGRRSVVIDDTSQSDVLPRAWTELFDCRSYLVTPLIRQGQVTGVMNLFVSGQPRPFLRWQIDLAEAIAGQLALAVANAELFEQARERLRETEVLLGVGDILSGGGATHEIMRRVAREVARAIGADTVGVYELDRHGEVLAPIAGYHVPPALLEVLAAHRFVLPHDPALCEAWRAGRAIWSADTQRDGRFQALEGFPPSAVLFAPAMIRGKATGALFAAWWRPGREFQPSEVRLVEGVAAQLGLAMDNAELARATHSKLAETQTLLEVSRAISSTLESGALLRHFLRQVARAVGADTAGAWLLSADGQWLEPVAGYHVPPEYREVYRDLRLPVAGNKRYAEAVRTRRPVVERDLDHAKAADPTLGPFPFRGYLFAPILAQERVIGGFAAVWWTQAREPGESELALIGAIASQAGIALENARLFEENRRQVEELTALHGLSRSLTGQLDRTAVLEAILSQVPRVFTVPSMIVLLPAEEGEALEVVAQRPETTGRAGLPQPCPEGPAGGLKRLVFEEGQAIRTRDYLGECARRRVQPVEEVARFSHWMGVPLRAGNAVLGVISIASPDRAFTDADERLLTNMADLAALALRSVRLFAERTRAYGDLAAAQDQLVRTEKLRALGEMASGVAHDFNNLLSAILGRTQLLQREVADRRQRQWLEVIERSAVDGAQTVRRLQEFTRIRRDHPFVAVDLSRVAREALEMTQSRWGDDVRRRGVTIETRAALEPAEVAGDPAELREALTNIILNAVDAMPEGGVLGVRTAAAGSDVRLTVTDSGVGMSAAIRRRIFDPFFTTKGPQGTGLGLSMTYGIVARHGGRIEVESEEGRGTTFRLTFPRGPGQGHAAEPSGPPLRAPASLSCLVVDDEASVGILLGDVLEAGGHRAVVCVDGADAVSRFQREKFDVVYTDLAMPGLSGWEVARAVKAIAPDVPVFIVTGFGAELSPEECRANGVEAVLAKPLSIQAVLDTAARVAGAAAGQRTAEQGRTP
jgi:GAF domain-containing protein/CheY-like chemotaxis protein